MSEVPLQPVVPGAVAKCKVPKLAQVPLASAVRRLRNAHCARGNLVVSKGP